MNHQSENKAESQVKKQRRKFLGVLLALGIASVVFFIAALRVLADFERVVETLHKVFGRLAEYNTFVYMVHNIVLWHIVGIALRRGMLPDVVYVAFSLAVPFVFIGIGAVVRRTFPRLYSVLIGYRG